MTLDEQVRRELADGELACVCRVSQELRRALLEEDPLDPARVRWAWEGYLTWHVPGDTLARVGQQLGLSAEPRRPPPGTQI